MTPLFLVFSLESNPAKQQELKNAIEGQVHKDNWRQLNELVWAVSFSGTSIELSEKLGISGSRSTPDSNLGSAMVTAVSTYWGRAPTDVWEWVKQRMEGVPTAEISEKRPGRVAGSVA